jgi:AcrR family transcriptional regulator
MQDLTTSRGAYTAHRESQRKSILDAAEDLFILKGIEGTTIGLIEIDSGVTRATIYQYFANKQEIAWALFDNVLAGWREDTERDVLSTTGTAGLIASRDS